MSVISPKTDEYPSDQMNSPHLAPKLTVEKSVIPALTLRLDDKDAKLQRWYDVTQETINRVGIRSLDFIPDGVARLTDKNGSEIYSTSIKLTDEFDGLPLLLARIEKIWSLGISTDEFWTSACALIIRSEVPGFKEVAPDVHTLIRTQWLEFACFWIAFLAKLKHEAGQHGWGDLLSGQELIPRFVAFYNAAPSRGPDLRQPSYKPDRNRLQGQLEVARRSTTNDQKKHALESLAESLLMGISGFEVFSNKSTATGEIDRWLRNSSPYPELAMLKSPILVECKYWMKTVGTDTVGAFIADLQDAGLTSGIFFSRKDISRAARRRIDNYYQREKKFILIVTEKDIEEVCAGANLARMIVTKRRLLFFRRNRFPSDDPAAHNHRNSYWPVKRCSLNGSPCML